MGSRGNLLATRWKRTLSTAAVSSFIAERSMLSDLRMAAADWYLAQAEFAPSFRGSGGPESGVIGVVGACSAGQRQEYLVNRIFLPKPGDLKVARSGAI